LPRKPSSVFVLTEPPGQTGPRIGVQGYRVRLDDNTDVEAAVGRVYGAVAAGTRVYVVEDTKVDAYVVGLRLEQVDDPRLPDEEGV
jgi:hypothetical protein